MIGYYFARSDRKLGNGDGRIIRMTKHGIGKTGHRASPAFLDNYRRSGLKLLHGAKEA